MIVNGAGGTVREWLSGKTLEIVAEAPGVPYKSSDPTHRDRAAMNGAQVVHGKCFCC